MNDYIIDLLSAGVIAALVTGGFSLITSIKNNKRLIEIEKSKQAFTISQEKFKALREAYEELLKTLPEEKLLGHIIINSPLKGNLSEKKLSKFLSAADENTKIIYLHFQKYCYLFSKDEQDSVLKFIEDIDNISKSIFNANMNVQLYDTDDNQMSDPVLNKILITVKFEEMYYNLYRSNLNKLC